MDVGSNRLFWIRFFFRLPGGVLFRKAAVYRACFHAENAVTMMYLKRAEFVAPVEPVLRD